MCLICEALTLAQSNKKYDMLGVFTECNWLRKVLKCNTFRFREFDMYSCHHALFRSKLII